jgi:hypothetical protein
MSATVGYNREQSGEPVEPSLIRSMEIVRSLWFEDPSLGCTNSPTRAQLRSSVIQDRLGIAHDHVLRPGRTIADLACSGEIETADLAEALQ